MEPIHKLLSRIRWDQEFAKGEFKIGYLDNVNPKIVYVYFQEIELNASNAFSIIDAGKKCNIPLHRVREVYKNGYLIWSR